MFTFVARGALLELMTVSRILVFCSVLSVTLEPPAAVLEVDAEPAAPPRAESVAWFRWPPCWTAPYSAPARSCRADWRRDPRAAPASSGCVAWLTATGPDCADLCRRAFATERSRAIAPMAASLGLTSRSAPTSGHPLPDHASRQHPATPGSCRSRRPARFNSCSRHRPACLSRIQVSRPGRRGLAQQLRPCSARSTPQPSRSITCSSSESSPWIGPHRGSLPPYARTTSFACACSAHLVNKRVVDVMNCCSRRV